MEKEIRKIVDHPMELYDFLRLEMNLTRRQIRQLKFRTPGILVDGKQQRVTYRLTPGQEVTVALEREGEASTQLILTDEPVEILYEDEDICLVNKPSGVSTHPGGVHYGDTIANMLMSYFYKKGESLRIRPVGRLDRETSGLLLFAKNRAAAGRLAAQRKKNIMGKEYLALVSGHLEQEEGRICRPLAADPENPCRMVVDASGKEAVTNYRVLARCSGWDMVVVWLDTGRMHQIRAHMASMGHPLLGDRLYGGPMEKISRAALHAWHLEFEQPFTGEMIRLEAPIPDDMLDLMPGLADSEPMEMT